VIVIGPGIRGLVLRALRRTGATTDHRPLVPYARPYSLTARARLRRPGVARPVGYHRA
jgi:hypothetical protein